MSATATATDRRFLVNRTGDMGNDPVVTIREVEPGTNAFDFSRTDAWATAQRLAQPNRRMRQPLARMEFVGLDMMTTDLGKPERVKAEPRARATPAPAPQPVQPRRRFPDVPAGRYALDTPNGVRFYVVDRPTKGKWSGYTFVNVLASDQRWPVRDKRERMRILSEIEADPRAASIRYGHEIGRCGICNRTLTDEQSRAAGIGPVCAGRMSW